MESNPAFVNDIGVPEELVPLLVADDWAVVCEYASIKADGTPVTAALGTFPAGNRRAIAVGTGLAYPSKAERARRTPKVCLLYSEPKAIPVDDPPVILLYGHATVRDADLQANLEHHVRELRARTDMFRRMPSFMLRWMSGYLARIWIEVTPLKILWWPDADTEKPPLQWNAPAGADAPPSDPPPEPLRTPRKPLIAASQDWRSDTAYGLEHLGPPILTVVDDDGYPVPFRARSGSLTADGVHLDLPAAMPAEAKGRACLTLHTVFLRNGVMVGNENMSFIGEVVADGNGALFTVERPLPSMSAKFDGPGDALSMISLVRESNRRAKVEAARRSQPPPKL